MKTCIIKLMNTPIVAYYGQNRPYNKIIEAETKQAIFTFVNSLNCLVEETTITLEVYFLAIHIQYKDNNLIAGLNV